jgi:putative membrane protein
MAFPSWRLARSFFPADKERIGRILLGAYLLTAWDLALDPAMSFLTPYWVWDNPGPFYGMPLVNLAGWMGTGMVLMVLLEGLGAMDWGSRLDPVWLGTYYGLIILMPLGMLAAAGLWPAVGVTLLALGLGPAVAWSLGPRTRTVGGIRALRRQVIQ